jgi:prephenate dehydrogenase
MAVQITIIGLGQIGTSVGLSLASYTDKIHRIGHDRRFDIAKQAEKMGALDRALPNLPASVQEADLVLLSIPMDQIRETMEFIAGDLKDDAVVMDTGPVKEVVASWASELLPPNRHYVGLTPVINPAYLVQVDSGIEAARADLFHAGLMGIVAPPRTSSEAIKLAADLTRLLGSTPLFIDPAEMDGLMAATHMLPQVMAAALLNATVDQPGWREGRKVAGRAFAEATGPLTHHNEPKAISASVLLNRENMVRLLDGTIAAMQAIRNSIQDENAAVLEERLDRACQSREDWWKQRQAGDWTGIEKAGKSEISQGADIFGRLLGLSKRGNEKKKK